MDSEINCKMKDLRKIFPLSSTESLSLKLYYKNVFKLMLMDDYKS